MKKSLYIPVILLSLIYNNSAKPMDEQVKPKKTKTPKTFEQIIAIPVFQLNPNRFMYKCQIALAEIEKKMGAIKQEHDLKFAADISLKLMKKRIDCMYPYFNPKALKHAIDRLNRLQGVLDGQTEIADSENVDPQRLAIAFRQQRFRVNLENSQGEPGTNG